MFYKETEFKDTPIGKIPKDWEIMRLGDILQEMDIRAKDIKDYEKLPILSLSKNLGIIIQEMRFRKRIAAENIENYKVVKKGWLVYNPYVIWEGAIRVMKNNDIGLISPVYVVWVPVKINEIFLDYLVQRDYLLKVFFRFSEGAVQRRRSLKKEIFKKIEVPIPPLQEQQKIAEILSTVDKAIEKTNQIIEKTERIKKALMNLLLTGKIRVEERNGKIIFRKETEFKDTPIGKIPKDWKVKRLTEVAEFINGYPFSPRDWKQRGIPIIRIQNLNDPKAEFNFFDGEIDEIYKVKNGDILFSWSASIGVYIWNRGDAVLNQHIFKVIPKQDIDKVFLYYSLFLVIKQLKMRVHGSTMKHFKKEELRKTFLAIPNFEEQQKIAEILSTVDKAIEKTNQIIEKTEKIKKALMNLLLTGKIRVKT